MHLDPYLVVHPTNRGCGLVHPSYKWTLPPQTSHENNQGCNPQKLSGMNHQVALPSVTSQFAIENGPFFWIIYRTDDSQ